MALKCSFALILSLTRRRLDTQNNYSLENHQIFRPCGEAQNEIINHILMLMMHKGQFRELLLSNYYYHYYYGTLFFILGVFLPLLLIE